jgi:hypothetical protein
MPSALSIAKEFARLADADGVVLCPEKLQCLLYYAQGWSLAVRDSQLFPEAIEAWPDPRTPPEGTPVDDTSKLQSLREMAEKYPVGPAGDDAVPRRNCLPGQAEVPPEAPGDTAKAVADLLRRQPELLDGLVKSLAEDASKVW